MLLQGLSLWLPATDDTDVDLQQVNTLCASHDLCASCYQQVPSYQSQVNWAKLLMEVEEHQVGVTNYAMYHEHFTVT